MERSRLNIGAPPKPSQIDEILEIGRRLDAQGWVAANDGNLSLRDRDGSILITSTGSQNGYLTPDDIVRIDGEGRHIWGSKAPSSEYDLHLTAYRLRPEVHAVVHAHPPIATAFAVARECLDDCVLPEIVLTIGRIPIAPYGTPGTPELGQTIEKAITEYDAVLLANHGAITIGPDLRQAYFAMERVEHSSKILFHARLLGNPQLLTEGEVERLLATSPTQQSSLPPFEDPLPCRPAPPGTPKEVVPPSPYPHSGQVDPERLRALIREVLAERLIPPTDPQDR